MGDYVFPVVNYHFTSIYQSSVYEALSKVISRLMPCQGPLERLLDMLYQVGRLNASITQCTIDIIRRIQTSKRPTCSTWLVSYISQPTPHPEIPLPMRFVRSTSTCIGRWTRYMRRSTSRYCGSTCNESLPCRPEQNVVGLEPEDDGTERSEDSEALPNGHAPKAPAPRRSVRSNFSGSVALANGTALCHWELAE
jgi:hypothetical protein